MPIRPTDLYDAAKQLDTLNPTLVGDEVCARTIANRAYYAAYLATREALRTQYRNPNFDVHHGTLAAELERSAHADVSAVGTSLKTLRAHRETSDYKPHIAINRRLLVPLLLSEAKDVLDKVANAVGRFPAVTPR
jgi:uncharacterized protein (UPF0332 family)